jgi:hypothetical protein
MPTVKSKALDKHNKWWGGDLEGVRDTHKDTIYNLHRITR